MQTRTPLPQLAKSHSSSTALIKESKGLALELRGMLKKKDPWDREVEFQRESLRKAYLTLIFSTTSSSSNSSTAPSSAPPKPVPSARSLDVLNLLWLETSHALIHSYRSKITSLDEAINAKPNAHRNSHNRAGGAPPPPGPTARRKFIHSFRSFLGTEEDFFRTLLGRLVKPLYESELLGLRGLGVVVEEDEEEELSAEERKVARSKAVPLAHKALVCFGDLARYRELYNEPGGGNKKDGRGKSQKGGERKAKNWSRAAECYHQARLLMPENGNPSNQLAVLAQYSSDPLSSAYHYYRALTVRTPFPTARTNLQITYAKAVKRYLNDPIPDADEGVRFNALFVALQGMYFAKELRPELKELEGLTIEVWTEAVRQRALSSDAIVKVVVTGLCALWDARMFRSAGKRPGTQSTSTPPSQSSQRAANFEPHLLSHVLSLYTALLAIGASETTELYSTNAESEEYDPEATPLAQNISAVLRRTLPALRILSKWIMGQLEYISRVEARVEAKEKRSQSQAQRQTNESTSTVPDLTIEDLRYTIRTFWSAYADFANSVKQAFPLDMLPSAVEGGVWLEEDVDMLGFAPLRRGMKEGVQAADGMPVEIARVGKDVHPNEEQLMRLQDVQADAVLIAESPASLVRLIGGVYQVPPESLDPLSPEAAEARDLITASNQIGNAFGISPNVLLQQSGELISDETDEEEGYEATEDDPVDLAMRISTAYRMEMSGDDDDDEEEIVYPSLTDSQILQGSAHKLPGPGATAAAPRNAADLLHQVLRGGSPADTLPFIPSSLAPSPPTASRSIWAPTPGSTALPQANASSIGSFEMLPNVTHQSSSSNIWGQQPTDLSTGHANRHGSFANGTFAPPQSFGTPPPASNLARSPSLFGNFSPFENPNLPFAPTSVPSAAQPNSDLSPLANSFNRSPQVGNQVPQGTGWPTQSTGNPLSFATPPPRQHSSNQQHYEAVG